MNKVYNDKFIYLYKISKNHLLTINNYIYKSENNKNKFIIKT